MSARSKARKRALDVLYAADARDVPILDALDDRTSGSAGPGLGDFAQLLVEGVAKHLYDIDQIIAEHAIDWTLERMPAVDRSILRLAVFELLWGPDIDPPVVIDEAVELAKSLSTDNSPRFINGVLGQVLAIVPRLREVTGGSDQD